MFITEEVNIALPVVWWSFEGKGQLRLTKTIWLSLTFKRVTKKGLNMTFKVNFQSQKSSKSS